MKYFKAAIGILIFSLFFCTVLCAQDVSSMLESYSKNFEKSDIKTKLILIEDAAKQNKEGLSPLFKQAIDYAVNVSFRGQNVSTLRQICLASIEQVKKYNYQDARRSLWKLFIKDTDSNIRVQSLKAIGTVGKGDEELAGYTNAWLEGQNNIYKTGRNLNKTIIAQCVTTIGELDQASSFPVVFNTMVAGYNNDISALCKNVLKNLNGEFKQLLINKINEGSITERRLALDVSLESNKFSETDKGDISEVAFEVALKLGSVNPNEIREIRQMRITALRALSERKRSSATKLVIHYFELIVVDYAKGIANKTELIDTIRALANMGNKESAARLTLYLDDLNLYTEKNKVYDEQIVLEVVVGLGRLQDSVAFDKLMRVKFLNYNSKVKGAADTAIKNLKW